MKTLYLRFTDTAVEDLERGTSLNYSGLNSKSTEKKDVADLFGCDCDCVEDIDGQWAQVLNGLCGFQLESDNLEDAIEEVENGNYQFEDCGKAVIFSGKYASNSEFVADGDLFTPISIEYEF